MNVSGGTYKWVNSQKFEILEVIDSFDPEEFQKVFDSQSPRLWLKLLEKHSDLIADFLSKTPKQRHSKLHKKYKDYWMAIHILALLSVERCLIFLKELDSFSLGAHHRELTSGFVQMDKRLAECLRKIRLGYER